MATRKVSRDRALKALRTLEAFGRQGYTPDAQVSTGRCVGLSVAHLSGVQEVVDAAFTMLEDWNGHLSAACINAIERGHGEVKRTGRQLQITLPESWEGI